MGGNELLVRNLIVSVLVLCTSVALSGFVSHRVATSVATLSAMEVAREQVENARNGVHRLHGILRPDFLGNWYLQIDDTHDQRGLDAFVIQEADHLKIFTAGREYTRAGTIQISSDDGFGGVITGHANLGLNAARIEVLANGVRINPADVWKHLPRDRRDNQNGNFWINMTMIE